MGQIFKRYKSNNNSHHSINKNPSILIILLWLKKLRWILRLLNLKLKDTVRITEYKNIFSKGYTENWSRKIFIIDSVFKTSPWTYKIKDLDGEKIIGSFYGKELLSSKL